MFNLLDDILDLRNVPSNQNPEMSKIDKHALIKLTLKQALHYKNYTCQLQTISILPFELNVSTIQNQVFSNVLFHFQGGGGS